jgi:glycogen debranching enzyme
VQPTLHQLAICVAAPFMGLSAPDGQITPGAAEGIYCGDVRALSLVEVLVDRVAPVSIAGGPAGPGTCRFVALPRHLGDDTPDPTVRLERARTVDPHGCTESVELVSSATATIHCTVQLRLGGDLADVADVKGGRRTQEVAAELVEEPAAGVALQWVRGQARATVGGWSRPPALVRLAETAAEVSWDLSLRPGERVRLGWRLDVDLPAAVVGPPTDPTPSWVTPTVRADDRRLPDLLARSLDDLEGLRLTTTDRPDDVFLAAGAPWYLTLFGRDSLWAARMMLPLGTDLAAGTLRTLAARQGVRSDPGSQEQPGKILHELRAGPADHHGALSLPPQYYGTVDATALWICLLHDAWRWGLSPAQVEPLLEPMVAALRWLIRDGDPDGDGFLEYADHTGGGLSNQGWKDSGDAVRFRSGALATGPIALCEVQGYAHEAARHGADLLDAFGRNGSAEYREWAGRLANRFRQEFWVDDPRGRYPAMALDADKRRVDALTSNIGHLIGTGLLNRAETAAVARRLTGQDLDSGFGLRTMGSNDGGYAPLSYHCGSVWPHDTAIAVNALCRNGHADLAGGLIDGLLAAGTHFDGRLPELYSGDPRGRYCRPVPYPAACHPQAWAAAAPVLLLQSLLGVMPDVPGGVLRLSPPRPGPAGRLRVQGLAVGNELVTIELDARGDVIAVTGTTLAVEVC